MDPLSARALLREALRRGIGDVSPLLPKAAPKRVPRLLDPKHKLQYAAFTDPSPKIVIDAGGRSGKTTGSVRWLMEGALKVAKSMNMFVGLTRAEGKLLAWDEMKNVNEALGLGFTFNEAELVARAPNGSKVRITGADKHREIRKARGHKYYRIVLEECGAQGPHLKEFVEDVLEPRTVDLNGQIAMLGTPNAARAGFFFDAVHGLNGVKGWSHHHWTLFENPYLPHARKWVEEKLFSPETGRGWTEDHPTYCREYLGKWVRDDQAMVYQFDHKRNVYKQLPEVEKWNCVLGIDIGWRDATAFVVWGWHKDLPGLYELYSYKRPKMIMSKMMKIVAKLRETFHLRAVVIDPAGAGRFLIEELNERYRKELGGIEAEVAEKNAKFDHIELFNDDLRTGKVLVRADSRILEEWHLLQWDETGEDEDERFENHLSDAALYGWRRAKHFRHTPKPDGPEPGSAAWERQLARETAKRLEKRRKKRLRQDSDDPFLPKAQRSKRRSVFCARTALRSTRRRPPATSKSSSPSPRSWATSPHARRQEVRPKSRSRRRRVDCAQRSAATSMKRRSLKRWVADGHQEVTSARRRAA